MKKFLCVVLCFTLTAMGFFSANATETSEEPANTQTDTQTVLTDPPETPSPAPNFYYRAGSSVFENRDEWLNFYLERYEAMSDYFDVLGVPQGINTQYLLCDYPAVVWSHYFERNSEYFNDGEYYMWNMQVSDYTLTNADGSCEECDNIDVLNKPLLNCTGLDLGTIINNGCAGGDWEVQLLDTDGVCHSVGSISIIPDAYCETHLEFAPTDIISILIMPPCYCNFIFLPIIKNVQFDNFPAVTSGGALTLTSGAALAPQS